MERDDPTHLRGRDACQPQRLACGGFAESGYIRESPGAALLVRRT
ncbi:hypothetical protein [Streptomyces sp. MZ04]|nr:hypothetical protein [Streptomyces sp. MZ04]